MSNIIQAGVIGYGYWGPNIVRNFIHNQDILINYICDSSSDRLVQAQLNHNNDSIKYTKNIDDIINDKSIDLVAIVTPVHTHYDIAKKALLKGKNIFIEKPFTRTVAQAEELIEIALKNNLMIMVDHTFLFTGAVKKMKEIIDNEELGDLCYYDSVRINLGLFQHDINVLWDLAPHDLSILLYLYDNHKPFSVNAVGATHFGNHENIAYLNINYNNNFNAHFHVNWLSPVKIRHTLIGGRKKMLVWDDLISSEKIKIYDTGVDINTNESIYKLLVQYRSGDMWSPKVVNIEALKYETEHLVDCMINKHDPVNNAIQGLEIVKILEASEKSIKNAGKEIIL